MRATPVSLGILGFNTRRSLDLLRNAGLRRFGMRRLLGGIYPRWSEDGSELFYVDPDGALMTVPIVATATTIVPGTPQKLFVAPLLNGGVDVQQGHQYDVAPDGLFMINAVVDDSGQPITLIQNWRPTLVK